MEHTTRIPKARLTGPLGYVVTRFSKRMMGEVAEPIEVMWHNRRVLMDTSRFGQKVQRWHELPDHLATFAHMAVASQVGCSWCLDFNYFHAHDIGLDEVKASEVPRWRTSSAFTPLERDVLAYAEAMTETPPQVTDDLVARLLEQLGAPAVLELTALIGFANMSTRSNNALGIESQELSSACALPLAPREPGYATSA